MGMVVRTNTMAMNANRQLGVNNSAVAKSLEKLSSGFKINRAADDASGLAISEKMKAQIKGLEQASANSQDGISLIQTAEGGAQEIHDMLNRMVELATKSANGTIQDDVDREAIQREVDDLNSEITRIAQSTNFNGINLLDGNLSGGGVGTTSNAIIGANVATFSAAKSTGATVKADLSSALVAGKDTFTVDGQTLTIDWTSGKGKEVFDQMKVDQSSTTDAAFKKLAEDLTTLFNDQMKEQGLSGSVKITAAAGGIFSIESGKVAAGGSIGWTGSDNAVADVAKSLGSKLFSATAGKGAVIDAGMKFNNTLTANDNFTMTINGTTVEVGGIAANRGDATSGVAASLQTNIRAAVTAYNTAMGTTGTDEELTDTDFTVEATTDGGFKVSYNGDKKVSFTFGEKTENGVQGVAAGMLGLTGRTSSGNAAGGLTLQIGDTGDAFNKVTVSVDDLSANGIGTAGLDVSSQGVANSAITTIKEAINKVSTNRANLGSLQNRLEHTINNLDTTAENMSAANSRIRDTDMAKEMMNYTKMNVLVQSAQAMLAQANQQPQSILQLLQ